MVTSILSWYQNDSFRNCNFKLDIFISIGMRYIAHAFNGCFRGKINCHGRNVGFIDADGVPEVDVSILLKSVWNIYNV
jgi:hypothetical protein